MVPAPLTPPPIRSWVEIRRLPTRARTFAHPICHCVRWGAIWVVGNDRVPFFLCADRCPLFAVCYPVSPDR
jgi:hypothetical protein